jgi:hypothetical protein
MQQPTSTSNILNYTQSFGAIHNNLLTLYGETFPDLIGTHEQIWQFMTTETTKELNTVNLPGANFISFSDANSYGVNIKSSLNLYLKDLQSQGIISPTIYELVDTILFIIKNFENSIFVIFNFTFKFPILVENTGKNAVIHNQIVVFFPQLFSTLFI